MYRKYDDNSTRFFAFNLYLPKAVQKQPFPAENKHKDR
jgi:hypothetical protein